MISGSTGGIAGSPPHDFSAPNVESIFAQPTCCCGCCGLQSTNQSGKKPVNTNSGKQTQVLSFPDSKAPLSGFNERSRINISTSRETSWKTDFQCPSYSGFKPNETQIQSVGQMPQQHCCFPPIMSGGSVEVVKVGEGPPLTWADLQRHGAFAFPEGDDWATPVQPQRPSPVQQPLQMPSQKCQSWKTFSSSEQKRTPISEYSNWSQRKKAPQTVLEIPPEFMIHQPAPLAQVQPQQMGNPKPMNCFFDQSKLTTTTAQTESAVNYPQHCHHPMVVSYPYAYNQCSCGGQNYGVEPWQNPGGEATTTPMRPISEVQQQKKFSLPPASHHSPEQRTSYRAKRIF
ncbi:unnamed protein product [Rodentolepis nana]|uniref:Protein FAM222B n=1 Tax=Rodentolepis nana TaxID=102285 RepID=A0A0R3TKP8_RODNA|nr:unnamed protein product [Rodentolepis nana]